jgi:hypothetical protein
MSSVIFQNVQTYVKKKINKYPLLAYVQQKFLTATFESAPKLSYRTLFCEEDSCIQRLARNTHRDFKQQVRVPGRGVKRPFIFHNIGALCRNAPFIPETSLAAFQRC